MFALVNSSKEKSILKEFLQKITQLLRKNLFGIPLVHISNSMVEFRQLSIINGVF